MSAENLEGSNNSEAAAITDNSGSENPVPVVQDNFTGNPEPQQKETAPEKKPEIKAPDIRDSDKLEIPGPKPVSQDQYKNLQAGYTKASQENAELRKMNEQLQAQLAGKKPSANQSEQSPEVDLSKFDEVFEEKGPAEAFKMIMQQMSGMGQASQQQIEQVIAQREAQQRMSTMLNNEFQQLQEINGGALSDEDQAAIGSVADYYNNHGMTIPPMMAYGINRYGNMRNMLEFARYGQEMHQQNQKPQEQPATESDLLGDPPGSNNGGNNPVNGPKLMTTSEMFG